ncbi:MAG TPA: TRAP transporter substrate-binding protein DctP [Burkholderiales bacterium]|nr:TRAP transporter substrate-binding protein DctP [Burkholderiales bacterium]
MIDPKLRNVSRRDWLGIVGRFGLTSTLYAAAGMTGLVTTAGLAQAADATEKKRKKVTPKFTLKMGAAGFNEKNLNIEHAAFLFFARDLEDRTDGAIRVNFIGDNAICNQLDCVKKTQQGIVDIFAASTQNSAGSAPYYNVLDYAYMFPSRASQFHFFYHPKSNVLFREPLRKLHNIEFLFTHCELRGIQLGLKWKDKPTVKAVSDLAGTKNRVTGTQLGRIAMQLLDLNPVPIAWEETLDGLKNGLIDGAETWATAVAYAGMTPVISQSIDLRFFCGTEHCAMNHATFQKLGSALQEQVMESAYTAQINTQGFNEAGIVNVVGQTNPPRPGTLFDKYKVRVVEMPDAEIKKAEQKCSPQFNPKPWEQWRERINKWSGGHDTYKEIFDIAREIPVTTVAENVEPRRWWKA